MNVGLQIILTRARRTGILLACVAAATVVHSSLATGPASRPAVVWPGESQGGDDPIDPIADRMGDVVVDLKSVQTGAPVQSREKAVVSDLDGLIAELTKQCKGSGGGGSNPTKPMSSSTLAKGPGGSGPMHDAKEGTRVWGQLPPKLREQILQSQTEGFPPGYEAVLASYYARLAQGQDPSNGAVAPSTPTTKPAAP